MTQRGRFITVEGGEGAGKSTQAKRLSSALESRGIACELTREPGGSPGAEAIRALLVRGEADRWNAEAETLLLFAARADHVARKIKPALANGRWVVCDRFVDSTYAYQGVGRGVSKEYIAALEKLVLAGLAPDLTLILDIDAEKGLARTERRAENGAPDEARFERFGTEFHKQLRQSFRDIAAKHPRRCILIDTDRSEEAVAKSVWRAVSGRFGLA